MTRQNRRTKTERRRAKVEQLERKVALSAPTQKKDPVPAPYAPGTYYGLVRRENLR
jgi:hypothetical protein